MNSKIVQQHEILQDDILIEKHGQGKFEGFRFYANKHGTDQTPDHQTSTKNENLVLAFSKRAMRFCACANGDFTLSSDGIVRWIGQPVGQLVATEDFFKPKLIILADAQLTGESRDNVVKRLERFVTFHFETALKPLFDLRNADNLTDSTHNLALQLVNSLGILPRREVLDIVKNLAQESRTILRRLGVRFGAFHIYIAGMLKPSPVQAITLLWNLQNAGADQTGLGEIFAALSAGRTSLIVDPTYNHQFYQLAGYRILGQRAVRIDILERLANLIRPALHWKQGSDPKPDGAYDGKSFFITPTMMSILGANGNDMEEILKGLGYQSYSINSVVFEQNLLSHKSSSPNNGTARNVPAAECVGRQWQASETTQEEKNTSSSNVSSSCVEKHPNNPNHLPEAEPVGIFSNPPLFAAKDKIILLWHYRHQSHHSPQKKRDKSGNKWQNKLKDAVKKGEKENENSPQEASSQMKCSHKHQKFQGKRANHKPFQKEKRLNPDSPFAKLAVLRDQLTKHQNTHTPSSKEH
ncbi:ATP-dependent RNA helicase SUPV3L1/SUV3 [Bartonella fuyuanensis]|uniref:ATP-dependent RNA helicase SUPV3L1/SUV3 n=1 Tax=Bartonella fuyuanensis TaxID=1460968 RepID=A0A840DVZ4_9HYPH|nr:hypothetical protein [Bartonella fuyuanensis]MBB4075735.1 ATP-dependent RNA helicase SUPV3L1/SUV3 [Bartonella fuyuanensis]